VRAVAWDTWAFVESALDGPRRDEVETLLEEVDVVVTAREVVVETFNFLVRATGKTDAGWRWWKALAESRVRIVETPLRELHAFTGVKDRRGGLSLTDYALGQAATSQRATEVATEDREFGRLGLTPLFAKR
jgi:predicted nucleic acid-binding protein